MSFPPGNPFDSSQDVSPFQDPSVISATRSRVSSSTEYNPYADDSYTSQASGFHRPDILPSPPPYSPSPDAEGAEYLRLQQEELERKAAELERREQEMNTQQEQFPTLFRMNNFPPLPSCCCIRPCFYQDISVDILPNDRLIVRLHFYHWLAYMCVLVINVFVCAAYFIMVPNEKFNPGLTLGLSILNAVVLPFLSYLFNFRAIYNAFKTNGMLYFLIYFITFFLHFADNVILSLGLYWEGSVGFVCGSYVLNNHNKGLGITMIIIGALFVILAASSMLLLTRAIFKYRKSGADPSTLQQEVSDAVRGGTAWMRQQPAEQTPDMSPGTYTPQY